MPALSANDLLALVQAKNWMAVAALVVFSLVRLMKPDTKLPINIPSRWRPVIAVVLGEASMAIYQAAIGGLTWKQGLAGGAIVGVGAIMAHVFGVDVLGKGKDVPLPKALSIRPPPPPPPPPAGDEVVVVDVPPPPKTPRNIPPALPAIAFGLALMLSVTGCSALHSAMPVIDSVLQVVQDGEQILEVIEAAADVFFAQHPDQTGTRALFAKADQDCHEALDAMLRATQGADDADKGKLNAALSDFRAAYQSLTSLMSTLGIQAPGQSLVGAARPRHEPLAMTWRP